MTTNRDIVTRAFADWSAGTGAISDIFAPEMRWEVVGESVVAGTYHSADEFITKALGPFNARFRPDSPYRPVNRRAIYEDAEANTVVTLFDGRGITLAGTPYENTYAWFLTLRDGRVVDGKALFDSRAFDDLWKIQPAG
ncbi:nuclear transport factor 2 family protein [Micromonospora olivasterospora]|uniref:SnoaL-like domain-containing protein n=1 Tax=Micromonospora olivasterospora TaxID=1880 RepID=A0A562IH87_MICOL|nr:nuclear transport factor 2 family protein [Micromonospora olivasterospora]TWH70085.1 hypothetical protein JD77_05106 [Micromonospora olivasterospora]